MTVSDAAAGGWAALAFVLFLTYIMTDCRLSVAGCAACLISLCGAVCGFALYIQAALFFLYLLVLSALLLRRRIVESRRAKGRLPDGYAIVVRTVDASGGIVSYRDALYPAVSRDVLYVYKRGDVCRAAESTEGALILTRF